MVLKDVPTGKIEIVDQDGLMLLQFNCACEDAMPYCKGMCCRMRGVYNVALLPGEENKFKSEPHPKTPGLNIIASKQNKQMSCAYQDDSNGFCMVHNDKPVGCSKWHCSPEGGDPMVITHRDGGWVMLPRFGTQQVQDFSV